MRANASAARTPARSPSARASSCSSADERGAARVARGRSSMPIVERHWLRCASSASILRSTPLVDALDVVDASGFEQQQRVGPVRRESLLGEEVRIARRDDAVDREQPGVRGGRDAGGTAATGRGRARRRAGPRGSPRTRARAVARSLVELAVDAAEELARRPRRAPRRRRVARLRASATSAPRSASGSQVPFDAVGADAQVHLGAGVGPLRERRAAAELDVVGVGADRERPGAGTGRSTRSGHGVGLAVVRPSAARSAASSTSKPSAGSRTIRTSRPQRRASAAWRAHEPGPYANANGAAIGNASTGCAVVAMVGNEHGDRARRRRRRRRRATSRAEGRRARRRRARGRWSRTHARPASAARVERAGIGDAREPVRARPRDDLGRARHDRRSVASPAAATTRSAIVRANARRGVVVERVGEARLAERERPQRDDDACGVGKGAGPTWPAYATERGRRVLRGEGRVLALVAVRACGGRSKARDHIPASRAGDPREQSRLVPRSADARVRRRSARPARAVPRQGRALRQARARPAAARRAPDPGAARHGRRGATRSTAAVDALRRGECVAVFPEGTISLDLEPMARQVGHRRGSRSRPASRSCRSGCGARTGS